MPRDMKALDDAVIAALLDQRNALSRTVVTLTDRLREERMDRASERGARMN